MKARSAVILGIVLMFGTATFAQDYAKIEIPMYYSYMRFNPQNNGILSGFSLNGGGGGVTFFFNHLVGIEAEFNGYASTTQTFTFAPPVVTPHANSPCPSGCVFASSSGNLFTYNVGPILKFRSGHFEPFVETLFGGSHSNTYTNFVKACQPLPGSQCGSLTPSNNAWDFIIGGGIDIPMSHAIAIRPVQFDYVLTRFGNAFTQGNNNQSNFRYQGGIVFRF